ncbi:hypothetical protein G6O69_25295 [Pseudenhygromyxa sp. WMMC2535]|uniref:hypothetical protein n=1 Tax=Pseudenhygromyxa sp. WMMC2535 TaxID=2712867 RepID=UPI0015963324|nr:hypothetical protein [Pseudenhygromyxa sp. WMMC2535]NVB41180.1 hypothetical protein [Pseudenhygromyxa sp. WMMC2535]
MAVQTSWNAFSAFQVFGDHVPMDGFSLVVRLIADTRTMERLLAARAAEQEVLDPELARMVVRAGLGLITTGNVSFVYANANEAIVLIRSEVVQDVGQSLEVHDRLISAWSSRMALISGEAVPVVGRVYEFPDLGVVRKALRASVDGLEQSTPLRSARRLGAQLRGRGEPFHESMIESIEEQTSLLEHHGVDMDQLPSWWWRGVAAKLGNVSAGEVELWSELPAIDEMF